MEDSDSPALVAVVEDDAASRSALARVLRASGFEAALFESAEAFIATPPQRPPLCLILDIHLGGMSGLDLQRHLRAVGSALPVIVTTGLREDMLRKRAERNGCAAFLWKPFTSDALIGAIGSIARASTPTTDARRV